MAHRYIRLLELESVSTVVAGEIRLYVHDDAAYFRRTGNELEENGRVGGCSTETLSLPGVVRHGN